MKIGVFDSGVGGKSVAEAIKKAYTEAEVILEQDTANLPYGTKENEELFSLSPATPSQHVSQVLESA